MTEKNLEDVIGLTEKATQQLLEAEQAFIDANHERQLASAKVTAATNRLNAAQRAFDEATSEVRKAVKGGDWMQKGNSRDDT